MVVPLLVERLLLFEPDMLFSSRIESAAARSGLEVKVTGSMDELQRTLQKCVPKALLVDLDALTGEDLSLFGRLRDRCKLVGYYSHADSKLAAEALATGFDMVIPRRSFVAELNELFAEVGLG